MESFYSFSTQKESVQAVIDDCLERLSAAPEGSNLGFIYATDAMSLEFPGLLRECRRISGIEHWVGSLGLGIISTGKEHYDQPAVSVMLAHFDPEDFSMIPLIASVDELGAAIKPSREYLTHFAVVHADPFHEPTQELISTLAEELENGFLVGGLTSSEEDQFQASDEVYSGGLSGVVFSENVPVQTNLTQGCSPVGDKHRITRAQDNVAFALDHEPALDVLMRELDIPDRKAFEERAGELFVGLCIPGSDQSDYLVRNLIGVDMEHKVFAINDYLQDDNEVLFCERNHDTAVADMRRMLDNLESRLEGKMPRGGIYVSCLGRGREQFGKDSEEIKLIHDVLGDFPLTGFFANGEIHHNKLYGYTGVLTLFT